MPRGPTPPTTQSLLSSTIDISAFFPFLQNLDFEGPQIPIKVVVGVDKLMASQLLLVASQLFKHLI